MSQIYWEHTWKDKNGDNLLETSNGYVFVNDVCVQEPGSDADFDRYAVEVQNGTGYYDQSGSFVRFRDVD